MTEMELRYAIGEALIENRVSDFWTPEVVREAGRRKLCPTVSRLAWRKYVESVKDVPPPVSGADIPPGWG